jgi:hypothetical protein
VATSRPFFTAPICRIDADMRSTHCAMHEAPTKKAAPGLGAAFEF